MSSFHGMVVFMTAVLKVENVKKNGKTTAVDDISFEVNEGEIVGLLGPNGVPRKKIPIVRLLA